jgi:hypothetical protein
MWQDKDMIKSPNNPDKYLPISHQSGNMIDYTGRSVKEFDMEYTFSDTLMVDTYHRGRSAAQIVVKDSNGRKFYFTLSKFVEILQKSQIVKGAITGKFKFVKQGANFSLAMVFNED